MILPAPPTQLLLLGIACCTLSPAPAFSQAAAGDFQVEPPTVLLQGPYARAQVVVTSRADGAAADRAPDLTLTATYHSANPGVAVVSPGGRVLAVADGETTVTATVNGRSRVVTVRVAGAAGAVSFNEQVLPILSRAGCNAGACHASQYGKGGFKLSVFGFAPQEDYQALVRDRFGRRVDFQEPARSLFLLKATSTIPHGGGRRIPAGSPDHLLLQRWVAGGARGPEPASPGVLGLDVFPARRTGDMGLTQQLRVTARYADGGSRDVTAWAKYDSMDEGVLAVSPLGLVHTTGRGNGAVMVRFEGQAEIARVVVPATGVVDLSSWHEQNFIDRLAAEKFREAGLSPSPLCDDATFLRRAYLDALGTLPTVEESTAFLASTEPDKRSRLVDGLLGLSGDPARDVHNNEYASYWSLKWSDLLRSNSNNLGEQGMWALHNWLLESFRENKRFDRFVRELITAKGTTHDNGPANFFVVNSNPQDLAEATAQLFLGVRLQCARCHHHPFESLSQADYHAFAAFFARVGSKASANYGRLGGPRVILVRPEGEARHPRTGQVLPPTPLHGRPVAEAFDRREALANWLTAPENRGFARNVVNRYFAYLLGRGLVEPIDDLRATNPPSNPDLLDAVADDFIHSGYDLKHLLRTLMTSRLYQLDSQPSRSNAGDIRSYSHYNVKRLAAEPLLDAIDALCGVPTKFDKVPLGTRAIELPDAEYPNYFLKTFGKPKREGVCECERVADPNLAQALHTLNSAAITARVADPRGRVARLLAAKKPHDEVVNELYLAALCRYPTPQEQAACRQLRAEAPDARTFYEDLAWSLINSKQFLFVH